MKKRLFSILLALCMVLCLVPTTAFAESETEEPPVCSCETACTAEAMNADCPICGVEGALPENCECSEPIENAELEGEENEEQPEGEENEKQPEGEVSDPQPETALTALIGGSETATEVSTADELTMAIAGVNFDTVKLAANISISRSLTVNRPDVTLDLNGYTLTSGDTECDIFSVRENGNLTVMDSGTGGKIDGQNKNCGFCIYGGVLTLESGTIINCMTNGDGGAVDISSGDSEGVYGKFVMSGGAITNCKADDDSGAVDIGAGCTFIMNSGTISGCRADDDAGAIFIKGNGSFVMNGGTIENCSACNLGGAVNIRKNGSFSMTGGTIKNCTVDEGGSGNAVYGRSDEAIVAISGGTIENCGASPLSFDIFTVSFDSGGGTPVAEQKVLNARAVRPDGPAKAGYIFKDWYVGENAFDFSVPVTENVRVVAIWSECDHAGSTAQPTCTDSAVCTVCGGTIPEKEHALIWQSENGEYWQKCSNCDFETEKKLIPVLTLNAPDKVCRTQDCTFTFNLPEGGKLITTGYEFEKIGGDLSATLENGKYTVELGSSSYPAEENGFKVTVSAETADGFAIKAEKSVMILNDHTGGKATCKDKAKCEVCGAEYGELDAKNHTNLKHFPATAATKTTEGNIEYWYCEGCGKYFSDKDGTKEIKKADTVTTKLKDDSKLPQTGDTSNLALWIALLFISGGAAIGTTVVSRKKKYNR